MRFTEIDNANRLDRRSLRASGIAIVGLALLLTFGCTGFDPRDDPDDRARAAPAGTAASKDRPRRYPYVKRRHMVRPGETLFGISWSAGKDFKEVARWNGLRPPYTIYPGQLLRLSPARARRIQRAKTQTRTKSRAGSKGSSNRHRVVRGADPRQVRGEKKAPVRSRATKPRPAPGKLAWRWPIEGQVKSTFSPRDATRRGIRIGGRKGQTVRAAEGGDVVYSGGGLTSYGRLIIIRHNDNYLSAYGHNRKALVKEGDKVKRGQRIAELGTTNDGKAWLHFEVRRNGRPINPLPLLRRRVPP